MDKTPYAIADLDSFSAWCGAVIVLEGMDVFIGYAMIAIILK